MQLKRRSPVSKYGNLIPIVDADFLIYRAGFAAEYTMKHIYPVGWAKGDSPVASFKLVKDVKSWMGENKGEFVIVEEQILEPLQNTLHTLKLLVTSIEEEFCNPPVLFLSGEGNFRYALAKEQPYKGNRVGVKQPTYKQEMIDYLVNRFDAYIVFGMEADDICSMIMWEDFLCGLRKRVLVAVDKDLLQVPGFHFNPVKMEFFSVSELEAYHQFFKQLLVGDSSDNIAGVKGVGDKTSDKLLAGCRTPQELFNVVYAKYQECYGEQALSLLKERGSLLWMLRTDDINESSKYIEEWYNA